MRAIILAGGKGTRLRPYTTLIPKPLVPIGKKAIIEIVIKKLKKYGFNHVTLAISNHTKLIKSYLGSGQKYKIKIDYSEEKKELGTFGPLLIIKNLPKDFLVMNGDILTDLNLKNFYSFHKKKKSMITISSFKRIQFIDFGIMNIKEGVLKKFEEKPKINLDVSMGIYCINRSLINHLKKNKTLGFDQVVLKILKEKKHNINVFKHKGYWLDIGRAEDYDKANNFFK